MGRKKPMSEGATSGGHFHAVRFYKDSESLCRIVGNFLGEGLAASQPAIVIATPAHRQGVVELLKERGIDADELQRGGSLILLDAEETLARFMVDGMPDSELFLAAMVPVIEDACEGRTDCVVRAYGEMVDVLWKAGHTVAATRLEMLWNDLAASQRFSLLCGYAMGSFYKDAAVEDICSQHSHIISETGYSVVVH
jgi:hypothetical protein